MMDKINTMHIIVALLSVSCWQKFRTNKLTNASSAPVVPLCYITSDLVHDTTEDGQPKLCNYLLGLKHQ